VRAFVFHLERRPALSRGARGAQRVARAATAGRLPAAAAVRDDWLAGACQGLGSGLPRRPPAAAALRRYSWPALVEGAGLTLMAVPAMLQHGVCEARLRASQADRMWVGKWARGARPQLAEPGPVGEVSSGECAACELPAALGTCRARDWPCSMTVVRGRRSRRRGSRGDGGLGVMAVCSHQTHALVIKTGAQGPSCPSNESRCAGKIGHSRV